MATFKVYKLQFSSPLHISNQHEDDDVSQKTILSDTMYAALTSCLGVGACAIESRWQSRNSIMSAFAFMPVSFVAQR